MESMFGKQLEEVWGKLDAQPMPPRVEVSPEVGNVIDAFMTSLAIAQGASTLRESAVDAALRGAKIEAAIWERAQRNFEKVAWSYFLKTYEVMPG